MNDWKSKVYKKAEEEPIDDSLFWQAISNEVKRRDRWKCKCCGRRLKDKFASLSVHHKIPRAEGGPTLPHNLVTLCNSCHDEIEMDRILGITCSLDTSIPGLESVKEEKDWHKWVYGGQKRPAFGPNAKK
jgi:hypothetical protein